ncbi:hypothetical protein KIW84_044582 [Lathyrus oleraceus]|uniref:RING-type E3 ubiquitin transferase n=1 Tax=Pisum sativum TaxID=3888 RepID=A0A9D4XGI3_PEA|nr:hypothetical protein KIW84_044582 [Pisum sativum]
MLIPLSIVDDVAIVDLGQQHHRHNMLPVYVLFDSRTMSHSHHPPPPTTTTTTPPWTVIDQALLFDSRIANMSQNHNNVPTRLMSHNHNSVSSRFTSPTVSVVDETVLYDFHIGNVPRRSRNHPSWSINHQTGHHHHHHHNGTRASPNVIGVQNTRASPVVIGVQNTRASPVVIGVQNTRASGAQDTCQHVTTSTTDAESICCICLVHLSNGSSMPIRLRCSHDFHTDCIQKWINIKKTCPLCRANV